MTEPRTHHQAAVFAGLGVLSATQEIAGAVMAGMPEADPELVAEETLCLLAVVSARVAQATGGADETFAHAILAAPFLYRDYLVGTAMLESGDQATAELGAVIGARLERKMAFYVAHFPPGAHPPPPQIREKMLLWMGRISPPKMPSGPEDRLDASGVVDRVVHHGRLMSTLLKA
ncbi:MAG: hypothetical protein RIE53_01155 [Rhodothermales bacterium]